MKLMHKIVSLFVSGSIMILLVTSCQKLDRPALGDYPEDPPPPELQILGAKSYWAFDGNYRDTGEFKMETKAKSVALVPGVTVVPDVTGGQAVQILDKGYLMSTDVPDALKNPGSFTIAFWMNGATGPVQGGAQGIFAISKSTQFWGNLEIFLENYKDDADPNAVFMKIHLYNANISGGGETWLANDDVKLKDVLGKWTHIALTYDGATSKISLYKDGVVTNVNGMELGGGGYGDIKWDDVTGLAIGSFAFQTSPSLTNHGPESWAKSFNGALDQFRIYTKALSATEVKNLYDNKL